MSARIWLGRPSIPWRLTHKSRPHNVEESRVPKKKSAASTDKRTRSSRAETETRILDAAEELFAARNPAHVTVREVAEKAGVTHALVHQYIGTKDDLLNAVIQRVAPERQRMIAEQPDLRTVLPRLLASVMRERVHSKSQIRSAMDGVEYASLQRPIETGQKLLALVDDSLGSGSCRTPQCDAMDPRIVLAGLAAMAYGWVATEDWLTPVFELQDQDPELVRETLLELASCMLEMIYPPADA